jgi:hypothetical protein
LHARDWFSEPCGSSINKLVHARHQTALAPLPLALHCLNPHCANCCVCCPSVPLLSLQDIIESDDAFTVKADAPGFDPADIQVQINKGLLTISGHNDKESKQEQNGKVSWLAHLSWA